MSNEPKRPFEEMRLGPVKAALWKNVVDQGNSSRPLFNVTFQRLYRDGQGKWHSSETFGRDDLLVLAQVAERAFGRICQIQQDDRTAEPQS